jgi:hypothetical protein
VYSSRQPLGTAGITNPNYMKRIIDYWPMRLAFRLSQRLEEMWVFPSHIRSTFWVNSFTMKASVHSNTNVESHWKLHGCLGASA